MNNIQGLFFVDRGPNTQKTCVVENNYDVKLLEQEGFVDAKVSEGAESQAVTTIRIEVNDYTPTFVDFCEKRCSYKGLRYIQSFRGMCDTHNAIYTIEELAMSGDRDFITVDGQQYRRSDYLIPINFGKVIKAGTVYSTDSARGAEECAYDRVSHHWIDMIFEIGNGKCEQHRASLLSPSQLQNYFKQLTQGADFCQNLVNVENGASTLMDFSVLMSKNDGQLRSFVTGAEFTDVIATILKIEHPFADKFDIPVVPNSVKECMRWLME